MVVTNRAMLILKRSRFWKDFLPLFPLLQKKARAFAFRGKVASFPRMIMGRIGRIARKDGVRP
jgi:hypothetical protein